MEEAPQYHTTWVTLEVEFKHHQTSSPQSVVDILKASLNYPAVTSVYVNSVRSDHTNHGDPLEYLREVEVK